MKYSNAALYYVLISLSAVAVANSQTVEKPCFSDRGALDTAINAAITFDPTGAGYNHPTYGPIETWCFTLTDFLELFQSKSTFNANISGWDVSSVNDMSEMVSFNNVWMDEELIEWIFT
jgi:surface protein